MAGKEITADYSGVKPQAGGGGNSLLPITDESGKRIRYLGRILNATGKTSPNDNPWVQYEVKVVGGDHDGAVLKYQSVVFLPKDHKYAGIALHFLKCILQPFEGKFKIRTDDWVGKYFYFYVEHENSTKMKDDGTPYVNARVNRVDVLPLSQLVDLGVLESEEAAPEWLQRAEAAISGQPAAGKPPAAATPVNGKAKVAAKNAAAVDEPAPTDKCEVCERELQDHGKVKHPFKLGLPF